MKSISRRALMLYALVAVFLVGSGILFGTLYVNADKWAMRRENRHVFSGGALIAAGTITDERGEVLAETKDGKRVYNDSKKVRTATLHVVGDAGGYIATGVQSTYKDALTGYSFANGVYDIKKYGKGNDMALTINADLCVAAYDALGQNKGTVGVYNYKTGQLVCVASKPAFDIANKPTQSIQNDTTGAYDGVYLNRFFSGLYTPGSTFKVLTSAAAMEHKPSLLQEDYTCTGENPIDGGSVKCNAKHGKLNFEKALNVSCNSVFSKVAVEVGKEGMSETMNRLGFNTSMDIGSIHLAKSRFSLENASDLDLGWAGIGQYTTLVNPCHMLTVIGSIANNGQKTMPYLVESIRSQSGREIYSDRPKENAEPEALFTPEVAKELQKMMRSTVKNKYGDSKFPKLEMCGKTGTAEVSSENGGKKPHAWFVGFSEREDFPYAIVVVAENGGSGGSVALPIASKVMKKAADLYLK